MKRPFPFCSCQTIKHSRFFHIRTVQHLDIIKVLFIHQLMHHGVVFKVTLKFILKQLLILLYDPFPSGFPTKTLYTNLLFPVSATWPAHLIRFDFITRKIFGEQYRSLSSSLCSFQLSPVTSALLGQNIPHNTLRTAIRVCRLGQQYSENMLVPYTRQTRLDLLMFTSINESVDLQTSRR